MARGNNYGSRTWSRGTIGGAMFGPAGSLAAWTTYGMTDLTGFCLVDTHVTVDPYALQYLGNKILKEQESDNKLTKNIKSAS